MKILPIIRRYRILRLYKWVLRLKSWVAGLIIGSTVPIFKYISPETHWPFTLEQQRQLPEGTLGRDIARTLDRAGYKLIPKFESHDAEHILFDYPMTGLGEIRLQFFLHGNGKRSWVSVGTILFGLGSFPELFWLFIKDYQRGKQFRSLKAINLGTYLTRNTLAIREELQDQRGLCTNAFSL